MNRREFLSGGDPTRFPTVIEGLVADGKLVVRAHDVLHGTVAGSFAFDPRKV